ncbi:MAG TPA: transaldolase [Pseudomonadota bacterium]|nr:transaldolase [Pseudomonadota bacterium]
MNASQDAQPSLLTQLKTMTVVVADTGDFHGIARFTPRDATTNPSLVQAAAQQPDYADVVEGALRLTRRELSDRPLAEQAGAALDQLAVEFGLRILDLIPGRVSTEVDARLSFDTAATIAKARQIIAKYESRGPRRERILIKIAATWEGIRAASVLEREGIHCNLTLLFGLHQAIACAEAGVTLISPFVGRILDWYLKDTGRTSYPSAEDPGVRSVTDIYNYYKHFGYRTEVMGASFRNMGEICELAGCDLLTISPKLLAELESTRTQLVRKLDSGAARAMRVEKIAMDERTFRAMHTQNRMADDKLSQGIADFAKAQVAVEDMLAKRLSE